MGKIAVQMPMILLRIIRGIWVSVKKKVRPQLAENDIKKIIGIQVCNFPPDLTEPDIVIFFTEHVDNSNTPDMLNIRTKIVSMLLLKVVYMVS